MSQQPPQTPADVPPPPALSAPIVPAPPLAEVAALVREADPNAETGMVRTSLYCHECGKTFLARIDFDIDGNHIIECAHCGHEHCRVIEAGKVTGDRWSSRHGRVDVGKRNVWKHNDLKIETSAASHFLRERWLNRHDQP